MGLDLYKLGQQLATGLLNRGKCCICLGGIRALSEDIQLNLGLGARRTNNTLVAALKIELNDVCLLYTSPSPRDKRQSRMPSSA